MGTCVRQARLEGVSTGDFRSGVKDFHGNARLVAQGVVTRIVLQGLAGIECHFYAALRKTVPTLRKRSWEIADSRTSFCSAGDSQGIHKSL